MIGLHSTYEDLERFFADRIENLAITYFGVANLPVGWTMGENLGKWNMAAGQDVAHSWN